MPKFNPIYPAHSIEQCAVALAFNQHLPDKALSRVIADAQPAARNLGLVPAPIQGFQFDVATGKVDAIKSGPSQFRSADGSTIFQILPENMALTTGKYVRWDPFVGQIEALLLPALESASTMVELMAVQLSYVDTFFWTAIG